MLFASLFICTMVSASNVEKIQFANSGDFSLELMAGVSPYVMGMLFILIDGMVGLKDGFIHTKKFGDNGAVDLGLLVGFEAFNDGYYWTLPIVARGGFHFEFVKRLDLYAGVYGGVELYHWNLGYFMPASSDPLLGSSGDDKGTKASGVIGNYLGAKWHFTKLFGVKVEFAHDWWYGATDDHWKRGDVMPWFAGGLSFNF